MCVYMCPGAHYVSMCTYMCMCRYPWRPEEDDESDEDGVIGVCESPDVGADVWPPGLMTEQQHIPDWVSPCQSSILPKLKLLHDLILSFPTCYIGCNQALPKFTLRCK